MLEKHNSGRVFSDQKFSFLTRHLTQPPHLAIFSPYSLCILWRDREKCLQWQFKFKIALKLPSVYKAAWVKGLLVWHHSKMLDVSTVMNQNHLFFAGPFKQGRTRMQGLKHQLTSVIKGAHLFFPGKALHASTTFPASQILSKRNMGTQQETASTRSEQTPLQIFWGVAVFR